MNRPALLALALIACGPSATPPHRSQYDALPRLRFNQLAQRTNVPVFWASDANENNALDPDEVRELLFYPTHEHWVENGRFTPAFEEVYERLVQEQARPEPSDERLRLVHEEFGRTQVTLVESDLRSLPETHRAFAQRMLRAADRIDALYAHQIGMSALASRVPNNEPESQSLFRRNWGPHCRSTTTTSQVGCSAIPGDPGMPTDVYPTEIQNNESFCAQLEARPDQATLLSPFTVVRSQNGDLAPVSYLDAYGDEMRAIAAELRSAADAMTDPEESAMVAYLRAAAQSFETNDWVAADNAWAAMSVRNSRWYLRIAPDETYWDPCSRHAGFHMTFALINRDSLAWQDRLQPVQGDMERTLAALTPQTYTAREVRFHMPDFIDITINAGDDRSPYGATIGQSLPNWGPVADESRGRTVVMSNLYTDLDSRAVRRAQAESMLTQESLRYYSSSAQPGLMGTILHEATHNLGPSHEYRVNDQTDDTVFGGGMASMLEELKAQSGALFFIDWLRERGVITEQQARETYLDCVVWAFGHISRGMYTPGGQRKAYSQLAAVQIGFLLEQHALRFDPAATPASGQGQGAFSIDYDAFPAAARALMTLVMHIKSAGDRAEADRIAATYVDGDVVPQALVRERYQSFPQTSFVYSVAF
jgi:hypothetical protein